MSEPSSKRRKIKHKSHDLLGKRLKEEGASIIHIIYGLGILKEGHNIVFSIEEDDSSYYCCFELVLPGYEPLGVRAEGLVGSRTNYSLASYNEENGTYIGYGRGVYSQGHRVGQLLFYLQLLLCIRSNVDRFELENMTDDPDRASLEYGIYGQLQWVDRDDGEMEYIPSHDSLDTWVSHMDNLLGIIPKGEASPWKESSRVEWARGGGRSRIRRKRRTRKKTRGKAGRRKTRRRSRKKTRKKSRRRYKR